jgi:hypothetical protein
MGNEFTLRGYTRWEHRRGGEVVDIRELSNLIMVEGRQQAAGLLNGATTAPFTWIAIGTSTTAVTTADVLLGAEITSTSGGGMRAAATCTRTSGTFSNDTMQNSYQWTFSTESTGYAVGESAVFASSSSGPMLCKQVFTPISVVGNDTLTVTWKVLTSATS